MPAASAGGSAVTHLELDTLLESAPMGILLTQDRRMVRANPLFAEMMRCTLDDLLGQPASMLWPDMETYAELGRQAGPVLASGGRFQAEMQARRLDGVLFWCRFSAKAVDPQNPQYGTLWFMEDTTEAHDNAERLRRAFAKTELAYRDLQAAQESLVQAEKMAGLGSMVAGVAHEINTPVGIVLTSASVLNQATLQTSRAMADGAVRKSDIAAYLQTADESARLILANAERAAHLIQSFKQVAVDQTSEQRRTFDLKNYLEELTTSLHPALKKGHASVEVTCAAGIQMDSYPGLLAQVLTNLTMNAITHAFAPEQQGHIGVAVDCVDGVVSIAFSDDGRGIAPEHMGRIFDPFFTTRRGQGGTGLGLHIVFNIVTKQLGGSIAVRNAQPHGACFDLSVPRVTPEIKKTDTA